MFTVNNLKNFIRKTSKTTKVSTNQLSLKSTSIDHKENKTMFPIKYIANQVILQSKFTFFKENKATLSTLDKSEKLN